MATDWRKKVNEIKKNNALMGVLNNLFEQRLGFYKKKADFDHTKKVRLRNLEDKFKRERAALRRSQTLRRKEWLMDVEKSSADLAKQLDKLDAAGKALLGNSKLYVALRNTWNKDHGVNNAQKARAYKEPLGDLSYDADLPQIPKSVDAKDFVEQDEDSSLKRDVQND